jgi:23S rRNA pseudouridine1911/1915/1917 synthase
MLSIVYEDVDLLVVDKPAGLVVHPAHGQTGDTLLDLLAARGSTDQQDDGSEALHPVHRLDRDTSGLLVIARTAKAHRYLAYQWQHRLVDKRYLALVHGLPEPGTRLIDVPLGRDPHNRHLVIPRPEGKPARTSFETIRRYTGFALLEVHPETGRTHQIRAHLAALLHPIAGDSLYGSTATPRGLTRQFLHAHRLTIRLPSTRQRLTFTAPLPPDLAGALAELPAMETGTAAACGLTPASR